MKRFTLLIKLSCLFASALVFTHCTKTDTGTVATGKRVKIGVPGPDLCITRGGWRYLYIVSIVFPGDDFTEHRPAVRPICKYFRHSSGTSRTSIT